MHQKKSHSRLYHVEIIVPQLMYVAFFTDTPTNGDEYLKPKIIQPLAQRCLFQETSEIIDFYRNPFGVRQYSANIFPVNKEGNSSPVYVYSPWCLPTDFHDRNKQIYLDFLAQGGDIYPTYLEDIQELRKTRLVAEDMASKRTSKPLSPKPEPEYHTVGDWKEAVESLLLTYIKANPNPNVKLAIVHTTKKHAKRTLEHFLSIANKVARVEEVKVRA